MRSCFFLFILMFSFIFCTSQQKGRTEKKYPVALLKQDLLQMQKALLQYHPGPDRHVPLKVINEAFAKAEKSLTRYLTAWEFYRIAAPLVAGLQCGHTRIFPSAELQQHLDTAVIFFPLRVMLKSNRMFAQLQDGRIAEVTEINHQPMANILKSIYSAVAVDGNAEDAKSDFIRNFAEYYARHVDHRSEKFEMVLRVEKLTENKSLTVAPVSFQQARLNITQEEPIIFKRESNIGILKITTFGSFAYRDRMDYASSLENAFSELRNNNITKLIVDIRGNGGGDDQYGALLISYLSQKPFGYFKKVYKRSGKGFVDVDHPCVQVQEPQSLAFNGKACLLIDGRTFSTAADVASVFKSNKLGVVIGRETGGGYDGNTSGASERVVLNNTGINVQIPLWFYENAVVTVKEKHRGVLPDRVTEKQAFPDGDAEMDLAILILGQ